MSSPSIVRAGRKSTRAAERPVIDKLNVLQVADRITEAWRPKLLAELNGQAVKLARLEGAFVWHKHDAEDELFYVVEGALRIEFRDRSVPLTAGDMLVVPRGVEHRPVAEAGAVVLLFEPLGTRNTGDTEDGVFTAPTDVPLE